MLKDIKRALGVYGKDEGSKEPIESMDALKIEFETLLDDTLGIFKGLKKDTDGREVMDGAIRPLPRLGETLNNSWRIIGGSGRCLKSLVQILRK